MAEFTDAPELAEADPAAALTPKAKPRKQRSVAEKDEILAEARERFEAVHTAEKDNKAAALEDTLFVYKSGKQWPDKVRSAREKVDEACLEFPQLKQFVNQVVNDQRQARPGIRIHPAGGETSKEDAERLQGIVRGIEYDSNAEAAYDTGFQGAVVGGEGYWRVGADYESPKSFNQKLKIQRVADPMTVWLDPDYQEPDGSDREYGFVEETFSTQQYTTRWPDAEVASVEYGNVSSNWAPTKDKIVVVDYYRRVPKERELLMLSDGAVWFRDELPEEARKFPTPEGVTIVHSRKVIDHEVEWFKIGGGQQILEEYEWKGKTIPVICCMGDEIIVEGKRIHQGLIRQARDAQRLYNYEQSAKVMRLALAPKAPWIAPVEAIRGYEADWETANTAPHSVLPYHHKDEEGNDLPSPQRIMPAPMESGWIEAAQQSKQDMRSVVGMYENSLGMHGQETSGRAILAREKQGDNSTFHFVDNHARAIALTGRIIVELAPFYYDTERDVAHVAADDTRTVMTINKSVPGSEDVENGVKTGAYAVTAEAGPTYATKRQEMSETMLSLVQSMPQVMGVAADLVVGSLDFADSDKLAKRLKLALPPNVQQAIAAEEAGEDPEKAALQQQVQQVTQQAQQALTGMQQQLIACQQELERVKKGDETKIAIEEMKGEVAVLKGLFDLLKGGQSLEQAAMATQLAPMADAAVEPDSQQGMPQPQAPAMQQQAGPPQGM